MLIKPESKETRDFIIGKGEGWRDKTPFKLALGAAWADWLFFAPLFVAGSAKVLLGQSWGFFVYWGALALAYSVARISGIEI